MTNTMSLGLGPAPGLAPLRAKWGWIVALGVVYVVAGVIALGSVVMATVATVIVVGIMMIVAGVAEVINAFQVRTWGRFLFWLAPLGFVASIKGSAGKKTALPPQRPAAFAAFGLPTRSRMRGGGQRAGHAGDPDRHAKRPQPRGYGRSKGVGLS